MELLKTELATIGIDDLDTFRKRCQDDVVIAVSSDRELLLLFQRHHVDVQALRAALDSKCQDTGHVMFAAGPAEQCFENEMKWRIPVYQSTSKSKGVARGYRVFTLVRESSNRGKACKQMWLWEGDTNVLGVPDEVVSARLLS